MIVETGSETVERLMAAIDDLRHQQQELAQALARATRQPAARVAVREHGRVLFVRTAQIEWIEASENYVVLHCGGKTHRLRETLASLQDRLDPRTFVRVHRSTLVNMEHVREVQPWFAGDRIIIMCSGRQLRMSRTYRDPWEERVGARRRERTRKAS